MNARVAATIIGLGLLAYVPAELRVGNDSKPLLAIWMIQLVLIAFVVGWLTRPGRRRRQ